MEKNLRNFLDKKIQPAFRLSQDIIWSKSFAGFMGRILGALSIITLIRFTLDFGISQTFFQILEYYENGLKIVLSPLEPLVRFAFRALGAIIPIHVTITDSWHHVFVLLQILFVRDAGVAFADKRISVGIIRLLVGFIIAILIAILSAIDIVSANFWRNLYFAAVPTLGIFFYDILMYLSAFLVKRLLAKDGTSVAGSKMEFLSGTKRASRRLTLGWVVTLAICLVPSIGNTDAPGGGLIALLAATVANAGYWLWRGSAQASIGHKLGNDWVLAFRDTEAGRFGMAVSGVLTWVIIFAALNTGLKLLGM